MSFERNNIAVMSGYVPGEQPDDPSVVKLNTNENPYPASKHVARALAAIKVDDLRRYPSPTANQFREVAAGHHQVGSDNIIPVNGGDELLRLAITTFAGKGDTIGLAVPGYSLYPVLAKIQGCEVMTVPLAEDWSLPPDFGLRLNKANARLALIVNPHAPTGILLGIREIYRLAETFNGVLLVDEAYVDFVDPELNFDLTPAVKALENLLILRTLSKGYSLAGMRFGYGIGSRRLLQPMMYKTRDSYNTDFVSQQLAIAALESVDDARFTWDKVRTERKHLATELEKTGINCLPSQSNFLLARLASDEKAKSVYEHLKTHGILVRYFDEDRLRDKLRITVGTPEQNQSLLSCLKLLTP